MVKSRHDTETLDLLKWEKPEAAVRYEDTEVRGANIVARCCRAMSLALKECDRSREEIAAEMSEYLGETVTKAMLDAYVSEARDTHNINIYRFAALVHATRDFRLLSLLPSMFGFAVIDERYLPLIDVVLLEDKKEQLDRALDSARRRARLGGLR